MNRWQILWLAVVCCFIAIGCQTSVNSSINTENDLLSASETVQNEVASAEPQANQQSLILLTAEDVQKWKNNPEENAAYSKVIFGDAISTIPMGLFENNMSITSVIMGSSISCVEERAFYGCRNLTFVEWSPTLNRIEESAFENTGIRELTLPGSVTTICDFAFANCCQLESCFLPDSLTEMGCNFSDCTALKTLRLPEKMEVIEDYSFSGCTVLESVTIPAAVKVLGYDAFSESGLVRLVINGELEEIRSLRTSNMPFLKQIVFCEMPPRQYNSVSGERLGLMNNDDSNTTVYCLDAYLDWFSPVNGVWNGFLFVTLSDLAALPQP